ncbi:uncharacterized protein SCHCODRAFT_02699022 [Schizophyllum commune H4-8]|uniref:Oxidoreductase AflY n=1 Tax=Schizophyllum commune (strain H4-8 / FGSC 9210) TaxID=578458 RepID=D8Q0L1_SCHCM|nr:uncharacterized protein SCHCODRAFT_02699022 [Schizophyllum commune H4-8]KAI5895057.1 hypothetical protein SCHCODRAFT_02699022 [Schizophyllum commune H4-8]
MSTTVHPFRTNPPLRKGLVNVPGVTPSAAKATQENLLADYEKHHCYFNNKGFHNHLSHHLLSAYDLGASASLLQDIYEVESASQRPLVQAPEDKIPPLTEENWTSALGQEEAYATYLKFFGEQISLHGAQSTIERYIFSPAANGNGTVMLARFVSGLLHPWIQTGFGVEFKQDYLTAMGLALAAVHVPDCPVEYLADLPSGDPSVSFTTKPSATLNELFNDLYASDVLNPGPHNKDPTYVATLQRIDEFFSDSVRSRAILDLANRWTFPLTEDAAAFTSDLQHKMKEVIVQGTLLLAGTGLRRDAQGRPPLVDFHLMHLVTAGTFIRPLLAVAREPMYQARLLHILVRMMLVTTIMRGRPRPDIEALYARPATLDYEDDKLLGGPRSDANGTVKVHDSCLPSPGGWPTIIDNAIHHPEPHVSKVARSLYYGAQLYETERDLGVPGVDGSVFLRAATVMLDGLGWVSKGEEKRGWDHSGLGWDEAWADSKGYVAVSMK